MVFTILNSFKITDLSIGLHTCITAVDMDRRSSDIR